MIKFLQRWWRRRQLNKLLAWARTYVMTPEEHEEQRRSFAFGNAHISNPNVTRKMVDDAAERMARRQVP